MRARGFAPHRPIGVSVFTEEEGSRFGLACLGSRLVTGASTWADARERRDRDGVFLRDALATAGLDPLEPAAAVASTEVGCFVELHVEQGRDLVDRDVAVGVASEIWPHGRYRFDFAGEANHAGTTRMEDRRDPMLTYAMTALAANKQARLAGQRATFGRLEVAPNGTNAVPSRVTAWLDARCDSDDALADLVDAISRQGAERAERDGTALAVTAESVSGSVAFDPDLAARPRRRSADWPVIPTQAGHDAGILPPPASRPRCSSSATRPGSRTRPTSSPRRPTAWPGSTRWPTPWRSWRRDDLPARARAAPRRRPRRRARRGRRRPVRRRSSAGHAVRRGRHGSRPHHPGPGEHPQPRLPPRPARAHPARAGQLLDLARPDVRRRRAPRPGHLPRPGDAPPSARWSPPASPASGSSTTSTTSPTARPYDDPNAMGHALIEAARVAGLRITLLDTLYLSSGFGAPPEGAQAALRRRVGRRLGDRVAALAGTDVRVGRGRAALRARACPRDPPRADVARRWAAGRPLHVHLSEQVAENEAAWRRTA